MAPTLESCSWKGWSLGRGGVRISRNVFIMRLCRNVTYFSAYFSDVRVDQKCFCRYLQCLRTDFLMLMYICLMFVYTVYLRCTCLTCLDTCVCACFFLKIIVRHSPFGSLWVYLVERRQHTSNICSCTSSTWQTWLLCDSFYILFLRWVFMLECNKPLLSCCITSPVITHSQICD